MSDAVALIAAIPRDDLPRLAWADWLDDHGRPERAELLRVQCDRKPVKGSARRVRQLLDAVGRDWPPELTPPGYTFDGDGDTLRPKFERGCLIEIGFDADKYVAIADRFAGREPLVDVVLFRGDRRVPPALASSPHLQRVYGLYGAGFGRLLASPHLHRLRHVHGCSPADVPDLAAGPAAGRVRSLAVDGMSNTFEPHILARVLADTPAFAHLHRLELTNCGLSAADCRTLVASPHLPPHLDLSVWGRGRPRGGSAVERALVERFPLPAPERGDDY